ncbi:TauD/TfdA family dioxygenase [Gynuella sunshinyii]|uniref:Putative taurine catabolism dioxygenase n=1 Tax=Gynuella sunshinyii YC6258 TaxID=1445510 RepID=A0A0C5VYJ7_9GAMM|nr:TauD/TfdA family dioxygenase [Gynuella sunshinyii]AJQ95474.1 putative taurine catabolism dioxygenase [Gynuella sunshinyii YC6258]
MTESDVIVVESEQFAGHLPFLVRPDNNLLWQNCLDRLHAIIHENLEKYGGILLRGFQVDGEADFQAFAQSFGYELLNYDYASTPRAEVRTGVYTSTEYPAHQIIPLHNEQAYTRSWPMKIWFHCITASEQGGETPIVDSRQVYQSIDPVIRRKFIDNGLLYVRNYGNGLDLPWQKAFSTDDPAAVENFCQANHIEFEWKDDGELRTRQRCQAVAVHPRTGETVWFNQAHLFHVSNLQPHVRETLLSIVEEADLPRNVYYGDGSAIDEADLDHVREVLQRHQVSFPWQPGDILMLDNMLVAHGRNRFQGERKIVVAMAEPVVDGVLVQESNHVSA